MGEPSAEKISLSEYVRAYARKEGLPISKVMADAGLAVNTLHRWDEGVTPRAATLQRLASVIGVTAEELALLPTGSPKVEAIARPDPAPAPTVPVAGVLEDEQDYAPENFILVPELYTGLSAGHGAEPDGYRVKGYLPISRTLLHSWVGSTENLALFQVQGDSMRPVVVPGQQVVVRANGEFVGDGMYAVDWDGLHMLKMVQFISRTILRVYSANPAYVSFTIHHQIEDDPNVWRIEGGSAITFRVIGKALVAPQLF